MPSRPLVATDQSEATQPRPSADTGQPAVPQVARQLAGRRSTSCYAATGSRAGAAAGSNNGVVNGALPGAPSLPRVLQMIAATTIAHPVAVSQYRVTRSDPCRSDMNALWVALCTPWSRIAS